MTNINSNENPLGTTGNGDEDGLPDVLTPEWPARCAYCKWTGWSGQLKVTYLHDRDQGVKLEPACPNCGSLDIRLNRQKEE